MDDDRSSRWSMGWRHMIVLKYRTKYSSCYSVYFELRVFIYLFDDLMGENSVRRTRSSTSLIPPSLEYILRATVSLADHSSLPSPNFLLRRPKTPPRVQSSVSNTVTSSFQSSPLLRLATAPRHSLRISTSSYKSLSFSKEQRQHSNKAGKSTCQRKEVTQQRSPFC
jgi:hypothetical protein